MRTCLSCGIEVTRYARRCRSCAAAHRVSLRYEAVVQQLSQARKVPRKKHVRKTTKPESRVRFDADAIRTEVYFAGYTIAQVERIARLPKGRLQEDLRKQTMPYDTLDKVACAIGCHLSQFEVVA
jgi:hypothetical protein